MRLETLIVRLEALTLVAFVLLMTLMTATAEAESVRVPLVVPCDNLKTIDRLISRYEEETHWGGHVVLPNNTQINYELTTNKTSGSWTLIAFLPNGLACLLAVGGPIELTKGKETPL